MKRLLVTGSRDWSDREAVRQALREATRGWGREVLLVSGHCPTGADALAEEIWTRAGGEVEAHPADWRAQGKKAGYLRNRAMVEAGADHALLFLGFCKKPACKRGIPLHHLSHGVSMVLNMVREAGIPHTIMKEKS